MRDIIYKTIGEVAEWPNAYAWKAYKAERSSGVRIPPSPQISFKINILDNFFLIIDILKL